MKNNTALLTAVVIAFVIYISMRKGKIILEYTLGAFGSPPPGKVLANEGFLVSVECQWAETATYKAEFVFKTPTQIYLRYSLPLSKEKGQKGLLLAEFTPDSLELLGPLAVGTYDMTISIFDTTNPTENLDSLKVTAAITVV